VFGDDYLRACCHRNPTEENPSSPGLLVLAVVVVSWLWRRPLVRALAGCGCYSAALEVAGRFHGSRTGCSPGCRYDLVVARFA
jgi:uncharacterized protein (TIGR03382 family)